MDKTLGIMVLIHVTVAILNVLYPSAEMMFCYIYIAIMLSIAIVEHFKQKGCWRGENRQV